MLNVHQLPSAGTPRVTATREGEAIIVRVEAARAEAPDELLAFPFGLEPHAARALVRAGTLPAAKIGRRTYARRSDVLALVDKLAKKPAKAEPTSNYAELVASARGRR